MKNLFIILLAMFQSSVFAQGYSIKVGLQYSNIINKNETISVTSIGDFSPLSSFNVGIGKDWVLNKKLFYEIDILVSQKRAKPSKNSIISLISNSFENYFLCFSNKIRYNLRKKHRIVGGLSCNYFFETDIRINGSRTLNFSYLLGYSYIFNKRNSLGLEFNRDFTPFLDFSEKEKLFNTHLELFYRFHF